MCVVPAELAERRGRHDKKHICGQRAIKKRAALCCDSSQGGWQNKTGLAGAWPAGGYREIKNTKSLSRGVSKFEIEYAESLVRRENPAACLSVFDYLCAYLDRAKSNIQINTYESYRGMIYGKIRRYFEPRTKLTVANLKPKDIQEF